MASGCHPSLPPELVLLCPWVGFASLSVKQSASLVGSLITCDVKLSSTHSRNLCQHPVLAARWNLHCFLVSGSEIWFICFVSSFSLSRAPGCKNGLVWPSQDRHSELSSPPRWWVPLLETSIEVENEGLASVTEAKENPGALANSTGISWPTVVLCGFPAKLLVLSHLPWHPSAFRGVYSLSQGLHPSGLCPMLPSWRTYC